MTQLNIKQILVDFWREIQ